MNLQVQPTHFQNINKNLEKIFHLSIIIDNPIYIIYGIEPELYLRFSISKSSALLISIDLRLAYGFFFFLPFHRKIPHFSHIVFTYTTYITYNISHYQEGF